MFHFPPWKIAVTIFICLLGFFYSAPNMLDPQSLKGLPSWVPSRQVYLGLDLQGGSHLLMQVDSDAVVRERMNGLLDDARRRLREVNLGYTELRIDGMSLVVRLRADADRDLARKTLLDLDAGLDYAVSGDGAVRLTKTPAAIAETRQRAVQQSLEIIRRRVDQTGTTEPNIFQAGNDQIVVQLPGVNDPERLKSLLGTTAKLSFRFIDEETSLEAAMAGRGRASSEVLPGDRPDPRSGGQVPRYVVEKRVMVSGESLTNAQPNFNSQDGQWVVSFTFDSVGGRRFAEATTQHVGRLFAIILDGKVISAPVIREPITGGRGQISGSFTAQSANDLAILLRAGALPAPLTILEERTIGPDLGSDSIRDGKIAIATSFLLILALIILAYGLFGVFAIIALFINLVMTLAIMTGLQATLTLPGLGGVVLSLAMAVDTNVLIYERMREEVAAGRSPIAAADAGFNRAFLTIIDSHVTALIAGVCLYALGGSGPVRGFAVTLVIGVTCSLFTAITVTRLMVWAWMRAKRRTALPI